MNEQRRYYDFELPGWGEFAAEPGGERNVLRLSGTSGSRVEIKDSFSGSGPLNSEATHRDLLLRFRMDDPNIHPAQLYEEGGRKGLGLGYDGNYMVALVGTGEIYHSVQVPFSPEAGTYHEVRLLLQPGTGLSLRVNSAPVVTAAGTFTLQSRMSGTALGAVDGSLISRSALGYFLPEFSQQPGEDAAAVTFLRAVLADETGLIFDYRFDEGQGDTVRNHAPARFGLSHHGSIVGNTAWEVS